MAVKVDATDFFNKSEQFKSKFTTALLMYATTRASEYEGYIKMKRPWTDRTGMAKTTLNAKVSQPNTHTIRITLAHGMDYGIWLELCNDKNYAVLGPALNVLSPQYEAGLNSLLSKMNF